LEGKVSFPLDVDLKIDLNDDARTFLTPKSGLAMFLVHEGRISLQRLSEIIC